MKWLLFFVIAATRAWRLGLPQCPWATGNHFKRIVSPHEREIGVGRGTWLMSRLAGATVTSPLPVTSTVSSTASPA